MGKRSNRPKKKMPSKGMSIPKLKRYDKKASPKLKMRGKTWDSQKALDKE